MIAAEKAGKTPQQFIDEMRAARPAVPRRLSCRLRSLAHDRFAGERRAVAVDLPRAEARGADRRAHDRAVLRSGQRHVPARPLHQGHVSEVRCEGPVRRQLRGVRLDLRADRPDRSVFGADRRATGAAQVRALLLPAVGSALRRNSFATGPPAATATARRRCSQRSTPRRRNGSDRTAKASPTGTSRATRRTSASRFPMRRASSSTCGSTRRSATWHR